jgi:hypothetical protein
LACTQIEQRLQAPGGPGEGDRLDLEIGRCHRESFSRDGRDLPDTRSPLES